MSRHSVDTGESTLDAAVEGDGSPTVIFENGLAMPLEQWDFVVPRIAASCTVLRYDHRPAAPTGASPSRSTEDLLGDLETLVHSVPVRPPFLLVGHSWGGVLTRLFAHAHPSDVGGLVFVDATHEALDSRLFAVLPALYSAMLVAARAKFIRRALLRQLCPPSSPPAYRTRIETRLNDPTRWSIGLRTARAECAAISPALERLRTDCPDLPPVPVQILTSDVQSASARRVHAAWEATAARSASARHTRVAASGHNMPVDCPDAVVRAIQDVVADMR